MRLTNLLHHRRNVPDFCFLCVTHTVFNVHIIVFVCLNHRSTNSAISTTTTLFKSIFSIVIKAKTVMNDMWISTALYSSFEISASELFYFNCDQI